MIPQNIFLSGSLLIVTVFTAFHLPLAAQSHDLSGKIAFLKDGEVVISDISGHTIEHMTNDSGKVNDFLFSPSLRYLAFTRTLRYEDEPGVWEENERPPQRAVCSIVIVDLVTNAVVGEILPQDNPWIYITKWLPQDRLLYYSSSGFDVSGFFLYDVQSHQQEELGYEHGSIESAASYNSDGNLKLYVDDTGVGPDFRENLHLFDLKTNTDRILLSKRSISNPRFSNDNSQIAFIDITEASGKYLDHVWLLDVKSGTQKMISSGPAKPKSAGLAGLDWSPDDRYLGMFFSPDASVIDLSNPARIHRIRGTDFSWTNDGRIVFARGDELFLYSIESRTTNTFMKNASKPKFLSMRRDWN